MKAQRSLIVCGLLLLFSSSIVNAQSVDYSDLVEQIKPSIAFVKALDANGKVLKTGTGFFVANRLILTNYHVIEGATSVSIQTDGNRSHDAQVDSTKPSSDLALLKVSANMGAKALQFSAAVPKVGERIVVVGNPLGLTGTVSDGIVSAIREVSEDQIYIQITAPISAGSSGSPVVNLRGEVIGVATLNLKGGQNLNFAIDSRVALSHWSERLTMATKKNDSIFNGSPKWKSFSYEDWVYDAHTVRKLGSIVSIWIRTYGPKGFSETLWEFNCEEKSYRRVKANLYYSNGELAEGNRKMSGEWSKITPNTIGDQWVRTACSAN